MPRSALRESSSASAAGYVAGDRTLGTLVMYFITGATIFSAFAFLGMPGWAYSRGAAARVQKKPDRSPVTEADQKVEEALMGYLKPRYPDARFWGEETGEAGDASATGLRFLVDPIDGTTNFVHGYPFVCTSIALEVDGGAPIIVTPSSVSTPLLESQSRS